MFVQMLLMLSQIAVAEPTEDTKKRLKQKSTKQKSKPSMKQRKKRTLQSLLICSLKKDFEMDLQCTECSLSLLVTD